MDVFASNSAAELKEKLAGASNIVLTGHRSPDGDAVGLSSVVEVDETRAATTRTVINNIEGDWNFIFSLLFGYYCCFTSVYSCYMYMSFHSKIIFLVVFF